MLNSLRKVLLILALMTGTAHAEIATIATLPQGNPIYFMSLAMAKAANKDTPLDLRLKSLRSLDQGAVLVNDGKLDFGMKNSITLREAYHGTEFYKGKKLKNLRLVARLVPLQSTLCVAGNSGIHTIQDMRGKRFPAGFDATKFGERMYAAMLGTGGLTYNDVKKVKIAGWHELETAFRRGDIDVGGGIVGSPTQVTNAHLIKGMRCISLNTSSKIRKHMKELFPDVRLTVVNPGPGLPGIVKPTVVFEFDYYVYASKKTPDRDVTDLLTGLLTGKKIMVDVSKGFRHYDPSKMHGNIGVPYHPAALKFFAEHKDVIKDVVKDVIK